MLKQQRIAKKLRPKRPAPNHTDFPTLQALALEMIGEFVDLFPDITVKGLLADALYGMGQFMDKAYALTGPGAGGEPVTQPSNSERQRVIRGQTE